MVRLTLILFLMLSHSASAFNFAHKYMKNRFKGRSFAARSTKVLFKYPRLPMRLVITGGIVGGGWMLYARESLAESDATNDLEKALMNGEFKKAFELINNNNVDINKKTADDEHPTLLDLAFHLKTYDVAEALLKKGADQNAMGVQYWDRYYNTSYAGGFRVPLICRYFDDLQALKILKKFNANINATDSRGHSLVFYFLTRGSLDYPEIRQIIEEFYDQGLKVSLKDRPVFLARQEDIENYGWWRFLDHLDIPLKKDPKARKKIDLYRALFYQDVPSAQKVFEKHPINLNEAIDCFGFVAGTWLNDAVISGDIKKVEFLLSKHAHPNFTVHGLPTAGELALELGFIEIASVLQAHMEFKR